MVQSSWAIGFAAAALVAGPVARYFGWRAVFFVGILPALVTLWIRRGVPESRMWQERTEQVQRNAIGRRDTASSVSLTREGSTHEARNRNTNFSVIFRAPYVKHTCTLLLFNFFCLFAWWGIVPVDPTLFVIARAAGRTRLWRNGHHYSAGGAQSLWDVPGIL
jgi:MFS family permease